MKDLETITPLFTIEYMSCDGSKPRNEFEIKDRIISELNSLKSNKLGHINIINIDRAIDIVRRA